MASMRRRSLGDTTKSRMPRSLSRVRQFFRTSEDLSNRSEEGDFPPPPVTPEIEVNNDYSRSVSRSSSSASEAGSNAKSDISYKSERSDKKYKPDSKASKSKSFERKSRLQKADNHGRQVAALHMEYTRSNPLGSALLDLVADNLALHKKMKFKSTNLRVGDLCTAFYAHMELERDQIKKELEASSAETEMRILDKELHAYNCKENLPFPKKFASKNVLINASARSDAIRIFPTKNKFNGTESSNGMNIHEFLSLVNSAQKQMVLSREEFLEFLLMCTTGRPHVLIKDWSENGENVEDIYHNLFSHYDTRMSPETAREKLSLYKARKNSTLNKAMSDIMQLALRAACVLPQGIARTASYNSEAVQALIRCLPPVSSDLASNKYHTISSRLQRPATFAELSRALAINAHSIDNEITKMGAPPGQNIFGNKPFFNGNPNAQKSNRDKKPKPQSNTAYSVTANTGQKGGVRNSGPPQKLGNGQFNQQGRKANAFFNQNSSTGPKNGNNKGRGGNTFGRTNNQSNNRNGYNSGNGNSNGNKSGGNRYNNSNGYQGNKSKNYCSLCGLKDHLAVNGCPNMMDDMGRPLQVHPCQTTCPDCPVSVQPRLNHSATYCPFRISGPLHGTK